MIHEVTAKTLLSSAKQPDPWFGIKYTMNLYRGCQHQCIYCDSRSECYQIENFADVIVKVNAIDLLKKELPRKRVKGTIGTVSMSDMPAECNNPSVRAVNLEVTVSDPDVDDIFGRGAVGDSYFSECRVVPEAAP